MRVDAASGERIKRRAAALSLAVNATLTFVKLVAAALTGSISLFSEAAHSATDVVASTLTYASVRAASVPPDDEHPYGHGKIESLAGFGESVLLFAVVAYAVLSAVPRLFGPPAIPHLSIGIGAMTFSAVVTLAAGRYVLSVGRQTESIALQSNGRHLGLDFITSCGVLLALVLTKCAHWQRADPVLAIVLSCWIAFNAWNMAVAAFQEIIDRRISDDELIAIRQAVKDEPRVLSYHRLRTRHSGSVHFVELHVVVPRDYSLLEAHEIADALEKRIETVLSPAHVVIHVDPFDPSKATRP